MDCPMQCCSGKITSFKKGCSNKSQHKILNELPKTSPRACGLRDCEGVIISKMKGCTMKYQHKVLNETKEEIIYDPISLNKLLE